ncbi:MAG: hypothetical protein WD114_06370 [Phycisphaerales bacterium]
MKDPKPILADDAEFYLGIGGEFRCRLANNGLVAESDLPRKLRQLTAVAIMFGFGAFSSIFFLLIVILGSQEVDRATLTALIFSAIGLPICCFLACAFRKRIAGAVRMVTCKRTTNGWTFELLVNGSDTVNVECPAVHVAPVRQHPGGAKIVVHSVVVATSSGGMIPVLPVDLNCGVVSDFFGIDKTTGDRVPVSMLGFLTSKRP